MVLMVWVLWIGIFILCEEIEILVGLYELKNFSLDNFRVVNFLVILLIRGLLLLNVNC